MEKITEAQLNNVLTITEAPSMRRLPDAELTTLAAILKRMANRYPTQDLGPSAAVYLEDYERLAVKFSLRQVAEALADLAISAEQKFFPRPDECAAEIERQNRRARAEAMKTQADRCIEQIQQWKREHEEYMREMGWTKPAPPEAA